MTILNKADTFLFSLDAAVLLALIVSVMAVIAIVAYKRKNLSASGAIAAHILGTVVLYALRLEGFFLLLFFFVTCNIVGKICRKKAGPDSYEKKGSCRDVLQVLANGLMAVLSALIYQISGGTTALIMFGAALAEATSDTLAGEIGRLSPTDPVSIRTFRRMEKGMSGAVTPLGIFGGFLGSFAISLIWLAFFPVANGVLYALVICISGLAGCLEDSFLGATAQALYLDKEKGKYTERERGENGEPLELVRGVKWLDNDMVNLSSNVFSCVLAAGLSKIIG